MLNHYFFCNSDLVFDRFYVNTHQLKVIQRHVWCRRSHYYHFYIHYFSWICIHIYEKGTLNCWYLHIHAWKWEKLLHIIPSIKVSFMWFRWLLVFNSSMGNIPCLYNFPARSQKYFMKCQISDSCAIVVIHLRSWIISSCTIFIDISNYRLSFIYLLKVGSKK